MSNENGTRLARQVRRFIENNPAAKSLENVEESAKKIILEIGNPDYFVDESEKFEPFPPEWKVKRTFESQYKKLQKEYTHLPDLKKNVSRDEEKVREEREKKDKEEQERKGKEDREKKDKDEKERQEREKQEREKQEREKQEREKQEREKQEREKQEREKQEKEKQEKEKQERDKQEKEDREKQDREKQDREKQDREKQDREKQDREKQDKQQMGQESNTSQLLDQLKSMDPEQLQGLLQDLEISSGRGSRETTADTTSSWNTRGSSVDPTSSDSGHWRKVRETFGKDTEYWLNKLSVTSKENDCDFADVKFYLEYLLRQDSNRSVSDLGGLASSAK